MPDKPRLPPSLTPPRHWAVTVFLDGEQVVTVESNSLSGREIGPDEEAAIRTAARHLLAFIGDPS